MGIELFQAVCVDILESGQRQYLPMNRNPKSTK